MIINTMNPYEIFNFVPRWLFRWGTPLEHSNEPLHLELRPATLLAWERAAMEPVMA